MSRLNTASASADPVDASAAAAGFASPHAIRFPRGIPGFEGCRSFVLMATEDEGPLRYLTAIDGPKAAFLVIDPRRVLADYQPRPYGRAAGHPASVRVSAPARARQA